MSGILYICGTPIGNLEDITLRQLRILREVDFIVAEDTRHTFKLLNYYSIRNSLMSYHEHNKNKQGYKIIKKLIDGKNIALVTDAGMPGISDPGEDIIRLCYKHNLKITVVPGVSAVIAGLVLSGMSMGKYVFEGFLPKNKRERLIVMNRIRNEERTIILYESPHNILKTLELLRNTLGEERIVSIVREITKKYEEVIRNTIIELILYFKLNKPRGEFVIVISGVSEEKLKLEKEKDWENIDLKDHMNIYINEGFTEKEAIKLVSKDKGVPKREIYNNIMKKI